MFKGHAATHGMGMSVEWCSSHRHVNAIPMKQARSFGRLHDPETVCCSSKCTNKESEGYSRKSRRALASKSRLVFRRKARSVGLRGGYFSPHIIDEEVLGSVVVAAASSGEGESGVVEVGVLERDGDDLISKIRGGQKVNKSIITKCKVGELREVCSKLGMEDEGTKPVLVERILGWLESELTRNGRSEEPLVVQDDDVPDNDDCTADNESEEEYGAEPAVDSIQSDHRDLSQQTMFVTWLGTSSGAPTSRRNVSSMALQLGEEGDVVLVDCGEGTRNQLRSAKIDPARVTHMFITHLHGDHCFGIAGGINAVMNARRGTPKEGEPFYIYGPPELHRLVLASCRAAQLQLDMPVYVIGWVIDPKRQTRPVLAPGTKMLYLGLQGPDQSRRLNPRAAQNWQKAYDSGSDQVVRNGLTWRTKLPCGVSVVAAQLQHRMPCWGYVFEEPGAEGIRPRKIVLLGDTCNSEAIAKAAMGCDVISHEATYKNGKFTESYISEQCTLKRRFFRRSIK